MIISIVTRNHVYYIECSSDNDIDRVKSILGITNEQLLNDMIEIGPLANFSTSWCSNVISILQKCNVHTILRIERSNLYNASQQPKYDSMTHTIYDKKFVVFGTHRESCLDIVEIADIAQYNTEQNLGMDEHDIAYYDAMFRKLGRLPTNVELYDLAQSNSEHSRHWFFRGILGSNEKSLMDIVREPLLASRNNSVVAFSDNASSIRGYTVRRIVSSSDMQSSVYTEQIMNLDITFTAETHNFPTGISPRPGAETGIGGRIRDNIAIGRGGYNIAGTAGYCVGSIIDDPYADLTILSVLARPIDILLGASNGASDYGNKVGEPIINGFARSHHTWIKPIMFTGGIGMVIDSNEMKQEPSVGDLVVMVGGPAYRIGMGGGSASSQYTSSNFNAVQRGDPEMENRVIRLVRACSELKANPIKSIHDQGAGGLGNVVKELCYTGAEIDLSRVLLGDKSLTPLEIWVAEYQEQVSILIGAESMTLVSKMAARENVPISCIGRVTGSGIIDVKWRDTQVVKLPLDAVLNPGRKKFELGSLEIKSAKSDALFLSRFQTPEICVRRVLEMLSVGSKRFLTNKVDRSVTGLIVQQQCVGPLHTPLADYAMISCDYGVCGAATAIGERPFALALNPRYGARLAVAEALTNIVFSGVNLAEIKCSANWMWPSKQGESARWLYEAAEAMSDVMIELGIAIDGGKDSMSMTAVAETSSGGEKILIKSPYELVISAYATSTDVYSRVTPEFKLPGSSIVYVDITSRYGLGGSSLARAYGKLGDTVPQYTASMLAEAYMHIVRLIGNHMIISGHDISDGGLITTLIEMCIAGNYGCSVDIKGELGVYEMLFSEGVGMLLEVEDKYLDNIGMEYAVVIGKVIDRNVVRVSYNGDMILHDKVTNLRAVWEHLSSKLDCMQADESCVLQEYKMLCSEESFSYLFVSLPLVSIKPIYREHYVGIMRDEGSNGDREMAEAFYSVGFNVLDITMNDLVGDSSVIDKLNGIAFVGGFTYADAEGSAFGWSAVIRENADLAGAFARFYKRAETFSLGVCNGCQLMCRLGWIQGWKLAPNRSGRFESRFSRVVIKDDTDCMLAGMNGHKLGVWMAHAEGQFVQVSAAADSPCMHFIDHDDNITMQYPFNPNGSPGGICAVISSDGRHLAMMGHPERTFLRYQVPHHINKPEKHRFTEWIKLFENAKEWCDE